MSQVDVLGLYRGIERNAFRLETLQVYDVAAEADQVAAFLRGDPLPPSAGLENSLRIIREHDDLATLNQDFVLFDDQTVMWYRYDDAGRLLGHERDDSPASLARCREARDLAVRWAVPLDEFLRSSSATMS